ncbi:ATP-dependent DNA helicase [Roseateles noduli]|nr:ATP-dependent DNA helicase [Roseateles noduli]
MALEGQLLDRKSLRAIVGKGADWNELAKDCVAFANATGGVLLIGIEDGESTPPAGQVVSEDLPDMLRKRIGELTINVSVLPSIQTVEGTGQVLEIKIPRSTAVASTTDGRYFLRIGDCSSPVTGDEVLRLAADRSAISWETLHSLDVAADQADERKLAALLLALRSSDRIKPSVREKSDGELLVHYCLALDGRLTNLGVLCIGRPEHRAQLGTSPVIQAIKYDERDQKVNKLVWDDHALSPLELLEAVWSEVPDFRESYELPDGLYRQQVPAYDEIVVRELLVNALVHRPYTQRGDIFINLRPGRMDIVNPGSLPLGVTPRNVLHTTVRRNEQMARLFHDLKLMEREGSGFDKVYEVLLSQGRPAPELVEEHDRVQVCISRRIVRPEVIDFVAKADKSFQLTQRERIALALLAQHDGMTARELMKSLELDSVEALQSWIKRLLAIDLVQSSGRTQAMRYFVDPALLRSLDFVGLTTLQRIEPHRLLALLIEDVDRYPQSTIGEIHQRVGPEIPRSRIRRSIAQLQAEGRLTSEGERKGTRYKLP